MTKIFGWILGLGTLVGAIYLWWSKRNDIVDLKTALEVQKIRQNVAKKEAELKEKLTDYNVSHVAIAQHEEIIANYKAEAVALATGLDLSAKSDQEIAKIFTDSGL